jgi:hypothetical protein
MFVDYRPYSVPIVRTRREVTYAAIFFPILFLILFSLPVITRLFFDYLVLGDGWRQGDWLINFGSGAVRRGIFGEAFIWLSDATGLSLRNVIIGIQVALWGTLLILSWLIWRRYPHRSLLLLLMASPMIFLMVWSGDVQGIMRKEILGYIAFAALVLAILVPRHANLWVAGALIFFTLGMIGNILHLFLVPALLAALYLLKEQRVIAQGNWVLSNVITITMALFCTGFALIFKDIPDLAGACTPLTERGLHSRVCDHAIRWLVAGDVNHASEVAVRIVFSNVVQFATVAFLGLLPLVLAALLFRAGKRVTVLALLTFVPMLPLYMMATDWGRWFSISYTVTVCLLLISQMQHPQQKLRRPSEATLSLLFTTSLLLTPAHGIGWQPGGVIASLIETFQNLF